MSTTAVPASTLPTSSSSSSSYLNNKDHPTPAPSLPPPPLSSAAPDMPSGHVTQGAGAPASAASRGQRRRAFLRGAMHRLGLRRSTRGAVVALEERLLFALDKKGKRKTQKRRQRKQQLLEEQREEEEEEEQQQQDEDDEVKTKDEMSPQVQATSTTPEGKVQQQQQQEQQEQQPAAPPANPPQNLRPHVPLKPPARALGDYQPRKKLRARKGTSHYLRPRSHSSDELMVPSPSSSVRGPVHEEPELVRNVSRVAALALTHSVGEATQSLAHLHTRFAALLATHTVPKAGISDPVIVAREHMLYTEGVLQAWSELRTEFTKTRAQLAAHAPFLLPLLIAPQRAMFCSVSDMLSSGARVLSQNTGNLAKLQTAEAQRLLSASLKLLLRCRVFLNHPAHSVLLFESSYTGMVFVEDRLLFKPRLVQWRPPLSFRDLAVRSASSIARAFQARLAHAKCSRASDAKLAGEALDELVELMQTWERRLAGSDCMRIPFSKSLYLQHIIHNSMPPMDLRLDSAPHFTGDPRLVLLSSNCRSAFSELYAVVSGSPKRKVKLRSSARKPTVSSPSSTSRSLGHIVARTMRQRLDRVCNLHIHASRLRGVIECLIPSENKSLARPVDRNVILEHPLRPLVHAAAADCPARLAKLVATLVSVLPQASADVLQDGYWASECRSLWDSLLREEFHLPDTELRVELRAGSFVMDQSSDSGATGFVSSDSHDLSADTRAESSQGSNPIESRLLNPPGQVVEVSNFVVSALDLMRLHERHLTELITFCANEDSSRRRARSAEHKRGDSNGGGSDTPADDGGRSNEAGERLRPFAFLANSRCVTLAQRTLTQTMVASLDAVVSSIESHLNVLPEVLSLSSLFALSSDLTAMLGFLAASKIGGYAFAHTWDRFLKTGIVYRDDMLGALENTVAQGLNGVLCAWRKLRLTSSRILHIVRRKSHAFFQLPSVWKRLLPTSPRAADRLFVLGLRPHEIKDAEEGAYIETIRQQFLVPLLQKTMSLEHPSRTTLSLIVIESILHGLLDAFLRGRFRFNVQGAQVLARDMYALQSWIISARPIEQSTRVSIPWRKAFEESPAFKRLDAIIAVLTREELTLSLRLRLPEADRWRALKSNKYSDLLKSKH